MFFVSAYSFFLHQSKLFELVIDTRLMNKLRSSSIVRPDSREDGFVKTSNVTKFLAACASYGLPNEDLFQRDDLIEATSESLARVAQTVIALFKFVDSPPPSKNKVMSGQATATSSSPVTSIPYGPPAISRASSSTPNLIPKPTLPALSSSPSRRRWSPPTDLPTLRSHSPDDNKKTVRTDPKLNLADLCQDAENNDAEFKPPKLPPKSPLNRPSTKQHDNTWMRSPDLDLRSSAAESTRSSIGDTSNRDSVNNEPQLNVRQSVSSSMLSDSTAFSVISSIFGGRSSSNPFGTIRTMTTDLTSEAPSFSRAEGTLIAEDLAKKRCTESASAKYGKERKMSEPTMPDLSRVVEETDESVSSKGHATTTHINTKGKPRSQEPEKSAFYLRKGKWPEDFMEALEGQSQAQPISARDLDLYLDQDERSSRPASIPPRKLAVVGAAVAPGSDGSISPRRPTHRPRHSVDVPPIITPKDAVLRRDSPDSGRLIPRRHSTKPSASSRNGMLIPRSKNNTDNHSANSHSDPSLVPFPQTCAGSTPSSHHSVAVIGAESVLQNEGPRVPRGRFKSEIEGASSSKRRARPSSYDGLGVKHVRSKFESAVDLGLGSGTASASDLMSRDSLDDGAVRMRLVVRENGKPPTHFVSFKITLLSNLTIIFSNWVTVSVVDNLVQCIEQ